MLARRRFLLPAAALPAVSGVAEAQTYPTRPVRLITPTPAGGIADLFARLYGEWLTQRLDQPFIIENRAGAGGNTATEAVTRAAPDGYTLLWVTSANAWNATLYAKLNFDFNRDNTPVASSHRGYGVLVVHPSFPAKTISDFIVYAKANPGKINMASGGVGSGSHLWGELFKMMAGVDMLHVPYRGEEQAVADLLAGQVKVMFDTVATSIGHISTARISCNRGNAPGGLAERPDIGRICAGLPSGRLGRYRSAQEHACRNSGHAQQGDQRWSRRSHAQGANHLRWIGADADDTCRVRQVHRRRNR